MIPRFSATAALCLLFLSAALSRADEIELRTGAILRGEVVSETDAEVSIRTEIGVLTLPRSDIAEIRRDDTTAGAAKPPTASPGWVRSGVDPDVAPIASGDRLYLATGDGRILRVDPRDGRKVWTAEVGKIAGLAADPGGVYATTTEGEALALVPSDGRLLWKSPLGGPLRDAPVLHRRQLFVVSPEHGLLALAVGTGRIQGRLELPAEPGTPLTAAGSSLLLGTEDGQLLVIAPEGPSLRATIETGIPFEGAPPASDLRTVAVARSGHLVLVDPETGAVTAELPVGELLTHPLATNAKRAFVNLAGVLSAVDTANGRVIWAADEAGAAARVSADAVRLLAVVEGDRLVRIRLAGGSIDGTAELPAAAAGAALDADGKAIVVTRDGRLHAVVLAAPPREDLAATESRTARSPDGYRVDVPPDWRLAINVPLPGLSVGLRPDPTTPRFAELAEDPTDRLKLELAAWIAVELNPYSADTPDAIVAYRLSRAVKHAIAKGYRIVDIEKRPVAFRGRKGMEVTFREVRSRDTMRGEWFGRVIIIPLLDGRHAGLHLRVPMRFRAPAEKDFSAFIASISAEEPEKFSPPEEVVVVERLVAAIEDRDLKAVSALLAEPLRRRLDEKEPGVPEGELALELRASVPDGRRRRVVIRQTTAEGRRHYTVVLSRLGRTWVVTDLGGLLR